MDSNLDLMMGFTPDMKISRILNGMWQVSGSHGVIHDQTAIESMMKHALNGLVTFDLADHYGPAEDFVKMFRDKLEQQNNEKILNKVKFFTKWVPRPQRITRKKVENAIKLSRSRMGMESLDLLQFHWWDYQDKNYIKAIEILDDLREEGILLNLGLTNFDTKHLQEFLDLGVKITSNQVQYSLIDKRPEILMQEISEKNDIKLLAYGTLGGGLLSEKYLNVPEPFGASLNTASLYKYKNMIDRWGNWNLFQDLLLVLKEIAKKYNVSIANVAVRYVLENPVVAGAIIGVRFGKSEHIQENLKVFGFSLDQDDLKKIGSITSKANNLLNIIGDCGDEYR